MKIIFKDLKHGLVKAVVENLDDLWYLSTIIDKGDHVEGETHRKMKVGKDENSDVVKKKIYLQILVEKVEFSKHSNTLRVSGTITQGPDDVPRGSYHTLNIEEGYTLKLIKKKWLEFQQEKLREASEGTPSKILICIFDREEAIFARLKKYGHEELATLKGQVQKKSIEQQEKNFYQDIIKVIEEYDKRDNFNHIIIASPSFFREYLLKEVKDENIKKKLVSATCSTVSPAAITEVLKRPELQSVLSKDRVSKEIKIVEKMIEGISKDGMAAYGVSHVKTAVMAGAVSELLVSDALIHKKRSDDTFDELENIMKNVEKSKGQVHIISTEHDGGKKLEGLGGIAGILRYKLEY